MQFVMLLCSAVAFGAGPPAWLGGGIRTPAPRMMAAHDAGERDRLLDALHRGTEVEHASVDVPSHQQVATDEDGEMVPDKFTWVDEHACIGCTYCASLARSTFFMEPEHGRARVFQQGHDADEVIDEAVASCPVNCIHYVSFSDLKILEEEREAQVINFKARLVGGDAGADFVPPTKERPHHCPSPPGIVPWTEASSPPGSHTHIHRTFGARLRASGAGSPALHRASPRGCLAA